MLTRLVFDFHCISKLNGRTKQKLSGAIPVPHEGGKKKRYIKVMEGKGLTMSLVLVAH